MKLTTVSIIPIEAYTSSNRVTIEEKLLSNRSIRPTELRIKPIFLEICGENSSLYEVSSDYSESSIMAFHESSLCICVQKVIDNWNLEHSLIVEELDRRNKYHEAIIKNTANSPIHNLLKEIKKFLKKNEYEEIAPSYVFNFYVIEKHESDRINKNEMMKLLEPSMIDMDDMISTESKPSETFSNVKQHAVESIRDVDISNTSETYISWATIVSLSTFGESTQKSINLLTALEMRLQIVWNRCYTVSQYIERIFDGKKVAKSINELFWSLSRTLDDAKSVLSSTLSSRSEKLFSEMIKTSKIEGEIARLEQKILLLEKYVEQKNTLKNKKYQKTIELLLFVTAVASLVEILFPLPISVFDVYVELVIVGAVTILGVYAIFKNK